MTQVDASTESVDDSTREAGIAKRTVRAVSRGTGTVRWTVDRGIAAGAGGGVILLRGIRALRRGNYGRGLVRLALGGLLVAVAALQRRSTGDRDRERSTFDEVGVADTRSDTDDRAAESELVDVGEKSDADAASGSDVEADEATSDVGADEATSDVGADEATSGEAMDEEPDEGETASDVAFLDSGPELDRGVESPSAVGSSDEEAETDEAALADAADEAAPEDGTYERLGGAAFDAQSGTVPVPQRAFNQQLVALDSEAFWGIRDADDAVLVSQLFDPLEEADGVRYVASSQIEGDRMLSIPDTVLNHWDDVAGAGTAVASGDEIVFATSDRLQSTSQLLVVPGEWADDALETGEE